MAAPVIQTDYDRLVEVARGFGRNAETVAALHKQVQRSVQALRQGGWDGRGATAFFAEMNGEIVPALDRLNGALHEAQAVTVKIKAVLQAAEEEAARPFRNAPAAAPVDQPGTEQGTGWWDGASEWIHGGLDAFGFIPGFGEIADGVNGLIYLGEGRYLEAGISAAAMVPILGDAGKLGKWGVKAGKELLEEGAERAAKEGAEEAAERLAGKGAGEALEFGKLAPNASYVRNGYDFVTDESGRVSRVSGDLRLELGERTVHQTEVGRLGLPGDEGGHLIGARFGGTPEGVNLVPQNMNLNRSAWKRMENEWAAALDQGRQVKVDIQIRYPPGGAGRPALFEVRYWIDGQLVKRTFRNQPGG